MKHEPSHLDIESPQFEGKPHIWIQWKGTDVCCEVLCSCGEVQHFDGEFFYFFQCPSCKRFWEVGTHVSIYEVNAERVKDCIVETLSDEETKNPQVRITRAIILKSKTRADRVSLFTELPSAEYPYTDKLSLSFQCAAGSGEEYVKTHFAGARIEVVEVGG